MPEELSILKERIKRLTDVHLRSLGAFNAYEQIMEFRAPNIVGKEIAARHAKAMADFKGFLNVAERSLNTELHISVAKLFDSHRDALHIEKLVRFAEQNQRSLTAAQQSSLKDEAASEIAVAYEGFSREDLLEIENDLSAASEVISRLKVLRDTRVAHLNLNEVDEESLTFEEFSQLIALSEKILNLCSVRFYGNSAYFGLYIDQVVGDSRFLLQTVDSAHQARLKQLRNLDKTPPGNPTP